MSREEFLELLKIGKFPAPILVEKPANAHLDTHVHDFEVIALVINGEITINTDGQESLYKSGDLFYLRFKQPHTEHYGLTGVKYLASRKS